MYSEDKMAKWNKEWKVILKNSFSNPDLQEFAPNAYWNYNEANKFFSGIVRRGGSLEIDEDFMESIRVTLPKDPAKKASVLLHLLKAPRYFSEVLHTGNKIQLTWG